MKLFELVERCSIECSMSLIIACFLTLPLCGQDWEQAGSSPFFTHHTNGFGYNGKAYVLQGNYEDGSSNQLWEFDPVTEDWKVIGMFPGPGRRIAIGDALDGKYYYGFGSGDAGRLSDLWVFDPVDTSFTELPSCPCIGRTHPALIAHKDKIFMGTGSTGNGDIDDWWEYDIETQVWTQRENVPGGVRHHPFFFAMDDYVYVGGGHVFNWLRYDMINHQWSEIDDLPQGRVAGSQIEYGGMGLLIGGDDYVHSHVPDIESFMGYDPELNEWSYLPSLPRGSRWAPSSFIIDSDLYFFGGISDSYPEDTSVWKIDLDAVQCLPPNNLEVLDIDTSAVDLFWTKRSGGLDTLKWRKQGESLWNVELDPTAIFTLNDLETCTDYEFVLVSVCGSTVSNSEVVRFKTDGCCVNPILELQSTETTTITIDWETVEGVNEYEVRWKPIEQSNWDEATFNDTSASFDNLESCTEYEFQIKSLCSLTGAFFSESFMFRTKGCGACLDLEYCDVSGMYDGDSGFIQTVQIGEYINDSGNNSGYASYSVDESVVLYTGESFQLGLESASEISVSFQWNVWIDFNADGDFENSEMVVNAVAFEDAISLPINIPEDAEIGLTRMRITYSGGTPNLPCENADFFDRGETEDYCVVIDSKTNAIDQSELDSPPYHVIPNPAKNYVEIKSNQAHLPIEKIELLDIKGGLIATFGNVSHGDHIDVSTLSNGMYFLHISTKNGKQVVRMYKQ